MERVMTRRSALAVIGAGVAAVVVGFDPRSRRWITEAEAARGGGFADAPDLDGQLVLDGPDVAADSHDRGNTEFHEPAAVLKPASVTDIQKMVRYCRTRSIKVAPRGTAHTTFGQCLTAGGLLIEMRELRSIGTITNDGVEVEAGALWREVLELSLTVGLTPPVLTGYTKMSVGGTLSVGGIGGAVGAPWYGAQIDNVRELEVVTGAGDLVRCSASDRSDLFEVMLGGLGQCGIITKAVLNLIPARPWARTYNMHYHDAASFFADLRTLLARPEGPGRFDVLYEFHFPFSTTPAAAYQLQATKFYDDRLQPPDHLALIEGLSPQGQAATFRDSTYHDFATFPDNVFDVYDVTQSYPEIPKSWFDVWLADADAAEYVDSIVTQLTPADVGPTGFVLIIPVLRSTLTRPFFRVPAPGPDDNGFVYLFDVLTSATTTGRDDEFRQRMLARNRDWWSRRPAGTTRYPIGSLEFAAEDWVAQYGAMWDELVRRKKKYDPARILTPGPGIAYGPTKASAPS